MKIIHIEKCCHSLTVMLGFKGKYDDKKAISALFDECPVAEGFKLIRSTYFYGTKTAAPYQHMLFEVVERNRIILSEFN